MIGVGNLNVNFIVTVIFISNFIGIVFSRTMHYQFYCWYFHMIPLLLCNLEISNFMKFAAWLAIEVSFNIFPATPWSSLLLTIVHLSILIGLYFAKAPLFDKELKHTTLFEKIKNNKKM